MTNTKNTVSDELPSLLEQWALDIDRDGTPSQAGPSVEELRQLAQSLRASIPGDVGVKGLEWTRRQRRLDEWKAHTSVGMYEVGEVHGRWSAVLRYVDSDCQAEDVVVGRFDSPDEAKAAAQADYERRILSALTEQQGEDHGRYLSRDDYAASDEGQPLDADSPPPSNPVISDEWQPIETAPKGQRLIVSNGKWFGPAVPLGDSRWFMWCSFFEPWDYERRNERPNCIVPTHWMPLPAAPAALSVKPQSGENR